MVHKAMAKSIVKLMLEKLEHMLNKEEAILNGSLAAFDEVKNELESLRRHLREADTGKDGEDARNWVTQLRDISFDVEDILDDLLLSSSNSSTPFFNVFQSIHRCRARHGIAVQIQDVRAKLRNVSSRRDLFAANSIDFEEPANRSIYTFHDSPLAPLFMGEPELVGIDKPREELVALLLEEELNLKVVPIVGMGGLGKTALARKVYDDARVKGGFKSHAWVTVTQSFAVEELLRNTIYQLLEERKEPLPGKIDLMEEVQLVEILWRYLRGKRYIVIFDDVWDVYAWDGLRYAFPNNRHGSRILITTRNNHVGHSFIQTSPSGQVYNLQPLSEEESWILFCKKAFQTCPGGVCPLELEGMSQDIVRMCKGLPLVIGAIGGLLSKKEKTVAQWKSLRDNLHSELANNRELAHIMKILLLSYNDLPYYLKSCFLYFSMFPRNSLIKSITLIRLWIAEGFIQTKVAARAMEDVALEYLNELIDRSMVQVAEVYPYGRIRSCRVHDLIQEIIFLKAEEENFSTCLSRQSWQMDGRIRRLSFYGLGEDALQNQSFSHLRALFIFGPNVLSFSSMKSFFSGSQLLRVLDLEGVPIDTFPIEFVHLQHLRYLSLRNTKISKLSKSLGKLKNLQTLDLKGTYITELPKNFLKLKNLRHLLAYHYYNGRHPPFCNTFGVKLPQGIGGLRELQKLNYLQANDNAVVRELGNLTQLKRLGVVMLRTEDGKDLCSSLEKLTNLHSFSATSISVDKLLDLHSVSSPPRNLQRLYLRGPLERLPQWVASLQNLVRMRLRWSNLREDSLKELQDLPNLVELTLIHAYEGENLSCDKGGFGKLKSLELEELDNLMCVTVEGAMPNLEKMWIRSCEKLEQVPVGIEHLRNLKELHLHRMPDAFVTKLRRHIGMDRQKIEHIPIVQCHDEHDRVYEEL